MNLITCFASLVPRDTAEVLTAVGKMLQPLTFFTKVAAAKVYCKLTI